ncbi:hypothetical protein AK88_04120 [Plasmodium fragile]|uniref:Merozoite surface protein MSA180 n=1 Tax=Plasmodium fragile TaxID=5857 RepID=A0A0D9QKI5_PLAFR|nr:uncharacterized protein AK88_04120 [Plasmodium fragile]KJP86226.1 hypothetical protein AK88_04120 [Plasmodium fragile]
MLRITPLFVLSILFCFFLFSWQNALTIDDDKNKRATLLALLKSTFIDNTENKNADDIQGALENINNMTLHPTDTEKFDKFLDHFFKFYSIYVTFNDVDKRVLHLSGVLNEVYVDVESLSKENLQKHFESVYEKGLNLINLILHSNLVHPKYDDTVVQGVDWGEDEHTDDSTQDGYPQEKDDPAENNAPYDTQEFQEPTHYDQSEKYEVTPEYPHHYDEGVNEEYPEDVDYENGEEYDAPEDPGEHDHHHEDNHDEHYDEDHHHHEDHHDVQYEYDEHNHPDNHHHQDGEYEYDEQSHHDNPDHHHHHDGQYEYDEKSHHDNPDHHHHHDGQYEYDKYYQDDAHDEPYYDDHHYVENKKKIKIVGKKLKNLLAMKNIKLNNNSNGELKVNFYTNYMNYFNTPYAAPPFPFHNNIFEYAEVCSDDKNCPYNYYDDKIYYDGEKEYKPAHEKWDMQRGAHQEGSYDVYKYAMKEMYDNIKKKSGRKGSKNKCWGKKKTGKYQIKEGSNGDNDDDDEDPDEDEQLQHQLPYQGYEPNNKSKYDHKDKKIHGQNVDDEETTDKAPTENEKKGIDFSYTYYNPYYMFKLGSNTPTAKGVQLEGGKGDKDEEEESEEIEQVDGETGTENNKAQHNSANPLVNKFPEVADYLEPSESKNNELLEDKNTLGQSNKSRPIHKKKEMKSKKMKTKKDLVDQKATENLKDTMYVKVGQNGTNGFLNFFDFREHAVKSNFKDLLNIMKSLKVFNITETIIFIEKLTQSVCASYCMGITDVLELANNDMLLYEKMSFHFHNNVMLVKSNAEYELSATNFENLLDLLNINKETIPLICPCKSYNNNMISYCKQYTYSMKGYFTQSNNPEYLEKFTPSYLLEQLILLQEKLDYIKKNGKMSSEKSVKVLDSKDLQTTAYYHNSRYFPPLKSCSASANATLSGVVGGGSGPSLGSEFEGGMDDDHGLSTSETSSKTTKYTTTTTEESHNGTTTNNNGSEATTDKLTYPDVDALNIYYNASPVDLKDMQDVKNVLIDEVKSKIFYINSYRIGDQFFPTYSNQGKDDHDLEIMVSVNPSKVNSIHLMNKGSPKLGHFMVPKLETFSTDSKGGNNNCGSGGCSGDGGNLANHKIMGNSDWIPLKSPLNHEDFYNAKKLHMNLFDLEGKKLYEKDMDESDSVNLKLGFFGKQENVMKESSSDAKDPNEGQGGSATDGGEEAESENNVNESDEHSGECLKLQSKIGKPCKRKRKKAINVKYLIYFFKNVHVWKTVDYCKNLNYLDNYLKNINYNEEMIFQEYLDKDTVMLKFASSSKNKYKVDMDYFIFLLQKISLIMYVEDLCGIFQIEQMKPNSKMDKYIEDVENIHSFIEKHILFSHEQFVTKNKYGKELSIISTANFFSSKKDIILNSQPYNNIIFSEKEIYEALYNYMEDVLTERMLNATSLTPYGFILYKPSLTDVDDIKLKLSQNEFITKYSRSAVDKYIYYEYRKVGNSILQHHADVTPKLSEHSDELKEYTLIIYNDNPSMTNIIIQTTVNVLNISFLHSLLEVILDIRATQQFFSYKGRFIPINAFIILDEGVNYLFFNYAPNENHINYNV